MKTAIKTFIWIGMLTCGILIVPIVVGAIALKKLNADAPKKDMLGIGALTLIFCSWIGGLLMLVSAHEMPDTENADGARIEKEATGIEAESGKKAGVATLVSMCILVMLASSELLFSVIFIPLGAGKLLILLSMAESVILFVPIIFYFCNKQKVGKREYAASLCSFVLGLACMLVFVIRCVANGFDDSMFGQNGMVCGMALFSWILSLGAIAVYAFLLLQNRNILHKQVPENTPYEGK